MKLKQLVEFKDKISLPQGVDQNEITSDECNNNTRSELVRDRFGYELIPIDQPSKDNPIPGVQILCFMLQYFKVNCVLPCHYLSYIIYCVCMYCVLTGVKLCGHVLPGSIVCFFPGTVVSSNCSFDNNIFQPLFLLPTLH